jgi:hypothetical protein
MFQLCYSPTAFLKTDNLSDKVLCLGSKSTLCQGIKCAGCRRCCSETGCLGSLLCHTMHYTENLKHIFPEMKLHGVVPNFYIQLGVINIFPQLVLFAISIFLYYLRKLSAQPQERWEGQGTAGKQGCAALPCPPLHSCGWAKSSQIQISDLENYGS